VDRRKDERFASDLSITLHPGHGTLQNVSASGVYIATEIELSVGQLAVFTLRFPAVQSGCLSARCEARVVRVEARAAVKGAAAELENMEFRRAP
jgi:hypothetical protein